MEQLLCNDAPFGPLKQIFLADVKDNGCHARDFVRRMFQNAFQAKTEIHCAVCDHVIRSLEESFFLFLEHPKRGDLVAMACSDICLRRALAHGIP